MSTSSSATSTELIPPENFGGKSYFSNKQNNLVVIISMFLVGLDRRHFGRGRDDAGAHRQDGRFWSVSQLSGWSYRNN